MPRIAPGHYKEGGPKEDYDGDNDEDDFQHVIHRQ
jgi:hypothetical protein